jgi:hypothetical protein
MTPVRIRYHRLWAPMMFLLVVMNIALFVSSGGMIPLALATMFTVLGVLYATRPLLVIDDEAISAKSLIGKTVRRIPHGSFAAIEVRAGGLVIGPTDKRQRLTLQRWMVSRKDLDHLAAQIREARAASDAAELAT